VTVDVADAGAVRIAAFDQPVTCDPHAAYDSTSRHVVLNVYEPLFKLPSRTLDPVPHLARDVSSERLRSGEVRYRLTIRDGVRDHEGGLVAPDDVEYSLRRAVITARGPSALWIEALLGLRVSEPDGREVAEALGRIRLVDDTVELWLAAPFPALLSLAAGWSLVLRREWAHGLGAWDGRFETFREHLFPAETPLREATNGTGPFRLETWDRGREELTFGRHEDYWGARPAASCVVLSSEPDRLERECSLLQGRSDFAVCQPESMDRMRGAGEVHLEAVDGEWHLNPIGFLNRALDPGCAAVGSGVFGTRGIRPDALADWHLRRALALSIDYRRFELEALDQKGISHFGPFPRPALREGPTVNFEFDLMQARLHLGQAWGGEVVRKGCRLVAYTHQDNYAREKAAELLAEGFNQLHPRCCMTVERVSLPALLEFLYAGQAPVAILGWDADYCHPYTFVAQLLAPDALLPAQLGMNNRRIQELADRARASDSPEDAVYAQIAAEAIREQSHLFFPGKVSYLAYRRHWAGVRCVPGVANVLEFASFDPRSGARLRAG
jgi:peptide/nickel transport system substrate-binding protein